MWVTMHHLSAEMGIVKLLRMETILTVMDMLEVRSSLMLNGGHTYRFKLVHVQMDPGLSVGDELGAGQIVARIMDHSETGSACSTGTHLHLEMWYDGAAVDPISIMSEDSGGGGFGCSFDSVETSMKIKTNKIIIIAIF